MKMYIIRSYKHETYQIFGRFQIFLVSKYVLQNYLVLSECWKKDIFGKGDRGFQIFYLEFRFFSSVLQSHAWLYEGCSK